VTTEQYIEQDTFETAFKLPPVEDCVDGRLKYRLPYGWIIVHNDGQGWFVVRHDSSGNPITPKELLGEDGLLVYRKSVVDCLQRINLYRSERDRGPIVKSAEAIRSETVAYLQGQLEEIKNSTHSDDRGPTPCASNDFLCKQRFVISRAVADLIELKQGRF